jgi:hypothetical protein
MPNWCYNELTLSVKDGKVGKHVLEAFSGENPFQTINPCPQELLDTVSGFMGKGTPEQAELERRSKENVNKYGHANWYDWCCYNWGTKWDVESDVLDALRLVNGTWSIRVCFDSAWCPPEGLYRWINAEYPDVEIDAYWEEPGIGQQGNFYGLLATFVSEVEDYQSEDNELEFESPFISVEPHVGAATVLPLPGGNKK